MSLYSDDRFKQAQLQKKYSSYYKKDYDIEEPSSYWSYFKLRITFSIILTLFVFGTLQTRPSKETRVIQTMVQSLQEENQMNASTLQKLHTYMDETKEKILATN